MDMANIRRKNLKDLLLDRFGDNASELSRAIGSQPSYVSDLLHGRKSFGEKAARKIEEKLSLDRGYLDRTSVPVMTAEVAEILTLMQQLPSDQRRAVTEMLRTLVSICAAPTAKSNASH